MLPNESRLLQEIQQSKPFASIAEEVMLGLIFTADCVRRSLAAVAEVRGVTLQQYNVLRILRGAGQDGLPTLQISERMVEKTPGVTGLVDRLVAKEWVRRETCSKDRRRVFCFVTSQGLALLDELQEPMLETVERAASGLSKEGCQEMIAAQDRVRCAVAKRDLKDQGGSTAPRDI